jgi:hypothetical protein
MSSTHNVNAFIDWSPYISGSSSIEANNSILFLMNYRTVDYSKKEYKTVKTNRFLKLERLIGSPTATQHTLHANRT